MAERLAGSAQMIGASLRNASAWLALAAGAAAQAPLERLVAPDAGSEDLFGWSVALHGTRALVGAYLSDDACGGEPGCQSGSAYVFEHEGERFVCVAELHASDQIAEDHFGHTVALAGDIAAVGTTSNLDLPERLPTVYVFERDATGTWHETARLHGSEQTTGDSFGTSIAIEGERIVVGAPTDDLLGYQDAGSVWVFERGADGAWRERSRLSAPVPDPRMKFGASLACSQGRVLVGAPGDAHSGDASGSAHVFRMESGAWRYEGRLVATDANWYDSFGSSVAIDGSLALVAAPERDGETPNAGAVYVHERDSAGQWHQRAKLLPHDLSQDLRFGWSVALSGSTAVVASPVAADKGSASGAVWVFRRGSGGWREIAHLLARDAQAVDFLGHSIAFDGELAIAGATGVDLPVGSSAGAAYVFQIPAFATPFCGCDGDAPCGNGAPLRGCENSSGRGAELAALGTNEIAPVGLRFAGSGLPAGAFTVLSMGRASAPQPFGDGWRCFEVARSSGALRVTSKLATGGGTIALGNADLAALAWCVRPGETWAFQLAFHDPLGPCGKGFGSSNALAIQF